MSLNHQFFPVKLNIKIKENSTSSTALSKSKTTDVICHCNESRFRCISSAVFIGTICTHSCIRLQQRQFLPSQAFTLNLPWGFPDRNVAFEPLKVSKKTHTIFTKRTVFKWQAAGHSVYDTELLYYCFISAHSSFCDFTLMRGLEGPDYSV